MTKKRIAITGLGIFCAAGGNIPAFTHNLREGISAIGDMDLFDVSLFQSRIGAQVRNYDPLAYFDVRTAERLSRADQFGVIAAGEALSESGVMGSYSPYEVGVSLGAGAAGMFHAELWLKEILEGKKGRPSLLRGILPDRTATAIALRYGLGGYQGSITTACSSSATAIGWGADLVASGQLKAVVCGGS
ncbi:MAG: beta-ketoacyl synthase N-terminal-like domain-containing protein, partial [Geobacteraceae bacterium]|nr:beta-ketoacyl synthase N-terminal-like domain-containing protein [Geobacteraceae bacterium]